MGINTNALESIAAQRLSSTTQRQATPMLRLVTDSKINGSACLRWIVSHMNWLDTQTKEMLQRVSEDKLAPPTMPEFTLVLLRKGPDRQRLLSAIVAINKCSEAEASALASRVPPIIINPDLKEEEALWGQFELVCCDAISVFLRSEVVEQNDRAYLCPLFRRVSESAEFRPATVSIVRVPTTESGEKFVAQFVGFPALNRAFPMTLTMPFKKARIMEHWASRIGAEIRLEVPGAGG